VAQWVLGPPGWALTGEVGAVRGRVVALLRPLRVPAFRRLWTAQLVSEVGDWSARLVLSVVVYTSSGSVMLTGLVTTVLLLPWLGPGQLLTGLLEQWPRRRVLVVADLARGAAFLVALLPLPIPLLLLIVLGAGLATPPFEAARSALRPEIVSAPLVPAATALSSMTQDLSVVVGYATGGTLVALLGGRLALLVNAASFLVSAALLAGLPDGSRPGRGGSATGALRDGVRALKSDPLVVRAVLLVTAAMFTATSLTALATPLVLQRVVGSGPSLVGLLVGLAAAVSLVATTAVPVVDDPALLLRWAAAFTTLGGGCVIVPLALISWATTTTTVTGLAAAAFVGTGLLFAVIAPANVLVSPRLPAKVRASALSLLMGTLVATEATGAAAAGLAASIVGVLPVSIALGVPALVVGGLALRVRPQPAASTNCTNQMNTQH